MSRARRDTVWLREPKAFGVESAKTPQEGLDLSGIVHVRDSGAGFSCIKFTNKTVILIGKYMPYGIGPDHRAFLKVIRFHNDYRIFCCYIDLTATVLLWKAHTRPDWVLNVRGVDIDGDT